MKLTHMSALVLLDSCDLIGMGKTKSLGTRLVYVITSSAGKVRVQRYGYPIKTCDNPIPDPLPSCERGLGMRLIIQYICVHVPSVHMYMYVHTVRLTWSTSTPARVERSTVYP